MTESSIIKTEVLSYLQTKVEYCSSDTFFKVKNLLFMGESSRTLGRICGMLNKDGLIVKEDRNHTPYTWRTNLMDGT